MTNNNFYQLHFKKSELTLLGFNVCLCIWRKFFAVWISPAVTGAEKERWQDMRLEKKPPQHHGEKSGIDAWFHD